MCFFFNYSCVVVMADVLVVEDDFVLFGKSR
jgi:hypothetical protein